jgi:hypothetical protein
MIQAVFKGVEGMTYSYYFRCLVRNLPREHHLGRMEHLYPELHLRQFLLLDLAQHRGHYWRWLGLGVKLESLSGEHQGIEQRSPRIERSRIELSKHDNGITCF